MIINIVFVKTIEKIIHFENVSYICIYIYICICYKYDKILIFKEECILQKTNILKKGLDEISYGFLLMNYDEVL